MPEHIEKSTSLRSIIPSLTVDDAARAIDFYKKAFGAEELMRMPGPEGKGIMHAELRIGDSVIFLNDEYPGMGSRSPKTLGGTAGGIFLSVEDVDTVFKTAVEAGAQVEMAVEDMFWGDRMGALIDPFGHHWAVSTHKEDVPTEELNKRAEDFFARMECCAEESDVEASV